MLILLLVPLGLGVLLALGFLLYLAWFWFTGQDYRTPQERAWEDEKDGPRCSRLGVGAEPFQR